MKGSATSDINHVPWNDPHAATHPRWFFRRDAFVWQDNQPLFANMAPFASEMHGWLRQTNHGISGCTENERGKPESFTNPYSYHATSINLALAATINAAHDFSLSTDVIEPIDAEVVRIRLQNELVLYVARFCEATIKQMLFCTQIPRRLYKHASLGQLLSIECDRCKKAKKTRHHISLLGALAHQYFLCHTLESCVFEHLRLVARRRNMEAAHSDAQTLNVRTAAASRSDLAKALRDVVSEFAHMVDHIGQIEEQMISEINFRLRYYPAMPHPNALMQIMARPPDPLTE
jgi:hypothetical protein